MIVPVLYWPEMNYSIYFFLDLDIGKANILIFLSDFRKQIIQLANWQLKKTI